MKDKTGAFAVFGGATPFLDRDKEVATLDAWWSDAREEGRALSFAVLGSQGVGKSRLVWEWIQSLEKRHPEYRVFVVPAEEGQGAYMLWRRYLLERFGLAGLSDKERAKAILREQVGEVFSDRRMTEILHFLGGFVGLQYRDNPFLRAIVADEVQHEQLARTVLRRFVQQDARRKPMVIVFEDLQLADSASLGLLDELARDPIEAPLILVAVGRSEMLAKWPEGSLAAWHRLDVPCLDVETGGKLVRAILHKVENVPAGLVDSAVAMTGGNPHFIEELLRLLVAQGIVEQGETWKIHMDRFARLRIPMSVEEAVQARLAALQPSERLLLEMASAVGQVFWMGAITALYRLDRLEDDPEKSWLKPEPLRWIQETLDGLVQREYLARMPDSWLVGEAEYAFNHNLEYRTIASSVDGPRAKRWHLIAAQWLEGRLKDGSEEQFEALAAHYEKGGQDRKAAFYYFKAADSARSRFANAKAESLYRRGLGLLDEHDCISKMDALHNLGDVCSLVGKSQEALDAFRTMLHCAYLVDNRAKGGAALGRIARIYRRMDQYQEAMERYRAAEELFETSGDLRGVAACLDDMGKVRWKQGSFSEAISFHTRALELRERLGDLRSMAFTLGNLGAVYHDSGRFHDALDFFQRSLKLYEGNADRQGVVHIAAQLGAVWLDLGETDRALRIWKEALDEAAKIGDRLQQAYLLANLGQGRKAQGDLDGAVSSFESAVSIARELGDKSLLAETLRRKGLVLANLGRLSEASSHLKEALDLARQSGSRPQEAAALRGLGQVDLARKLYPEAEERLLEALSRFEGLGHKLEEAATCEVLAEYYDEMGEPDKADSYRKKNRTIRAALTEAATQVGSKATDAGGDIDVHVDE